MNFVKPLMLMFPHCTLNSCDLICYAYTLQDKFFVMDTELCPLLLRGKQILSGGQ